jgi:hypothetical protein
VRIPLVVPLLVGLAACGKSNKFTDGGPDIDARSIDSGATIDAGVPDANLPLPAYEVTGGAAHVSGAHHAADVQIGHSVDQSPTSGSAHTVQGNAAVKP